MRNLLVMKFGGTSMGSADRIRVAGGLAREHQAQRPTVVVVSAMSKITDLLLDTLRAAEHGDAAAVEANLATLSTRHLSTCQELLTGPALAEAERGVEGIVSEFRRIAAGVRMLGREPGLHHERAPGATR